MGSEGSNLKKDLKQARKYQKKRKEMTQSEIVAEDDALNSLYSSELIDEMKKELLSEN